MAVKFKKGDTVVVTTGRSKGVSGEILHITPGNARVVVQGANMVKRHTRPSSGNPGGIVEKEAPVDISNISHVDPKTDKPTRVGFKVLDDGRKVRYAKRSGELIDQ
jgi:large subunit ribosomal protein L24